MARVHERSFRIPDAISLVPVSAVSPLGCRHGCGRDITDVVVVVTAVLSELDEE
jgi:hypothetical protein